LSANGDHIAVSMSRDSRTVIYAVDGPGISSDVPGSHVGWSPEGSMIAVCGTTLTLLDADARADVVKVDLPQPATGEPVFSPDGTRIAVAAGNRILVVET
jgi:hypothetical protein